MPSPRGTIEFAHSLGDPRPCAIDPRPGGAHFTWASRSVCSEGNPGVDSTHPGKGPRTGTPKLRVSVEERTSVPCWRQARGLPSDESEGPPVESSQLPQRKTARPAWGLALSSPAADRRPVVRRGSETPPGSSRESGSARLAPAPRYGVLVGARALAAALRIPSRSRPRGAGP
jgi:hypothetical protein